ncbi:unnamed protein product [Camellia sinensis]
MGSGSQLVFLSLILTYLVGLTIAQPVLFNYCTETSNYTSNSTYQTNLNALLSSLSSNTDKYGFYSSSVGENSDRVNAIVLCRGDVQLETCRSCINNATSKLVQLCPNQKEAIGWSELCMLRYSNNYINGTVADLPLLFLPNPNYVTNTSLDQFNNDLRTLLDRLRSQASSGDHRRKFAAGNTAAPEFKTLYGLEQCTPDLSQQQCRDCLTKAIEAIPTFFAGKQGGRLSTPSCNFRFETYSFFNEIPADSPPPLSPPAETAQPHVRPQAKNQRKDDNTTQTVIIIVVSVISFVIVLIVCICIFLRKRKQRKPKKNVEICKDMDEISTEESLQYDFHTISVATNNFSDANKLGQGGFGVVYRGRLPNGREIAVKRLSSDSRQGELEFKNEVMLVAKLQHRNLVRLLGFCLEGIERILIYEFVANLSLNNFIFDPINRAQLNWDMRHNIIRGISRGLLYLHEDSRLRIIHRDLKASNVLLDAQMNPKISDFGMARLFILDETHGNTSRIVGTYGYMAPEYAMHGQFSIKSDVFSFGVLVLEIVSGQKNNCFQNWDNVEDLLSYAWKTWREGTISNLIDPALRDGLGSISEIMRCIHIGLLCVQENVVVRPTMASVVVMLNSLSLTLSLPLEPTSFPLSTINSEMPLLQENNYV